MTRPLVSIVCTVYNKAPWIKKTILSFLEQETDFPIEILVIDDASSDNSVEIIEGLVQRFPDKIRFHCNTENLGIAKTWVKICKEARGDYIARCDGDDFWLDRKKLKKQVELLQNRPDSRWSNSDFDIYDENGEFVSKSGFENGFISLADDYELMLATRGFTMASTWLVERELMLEVNELIDLDSADDTFNIQLEMFKRTNLAYLPESTVAYVVNHGSDSKPVSFEQMEERYDKLLRTQKEYVRRYPEELSMRFTDLLLERTNEFDKELTKRFAGIERIGYETVTIFYSDQEENQKVLKNFVFSLAREGKIEVELPPGTKEFRLDLSEQPAYFDSVQVSLETGTVLESNWTNGVQNLDGYLFTNPDPQIIYGLPIDYSGQKIRIKYRTSELNNVWDSKYLGVRLTNQVVDLQRKYNDTLKRYDQLREEYETMKNSRRWKVSTKIVEFFRRKK